MPKGRAVHQAHLKMKAMARMLYRHDKIDKATVDELATLANIKIPTLKSAILNQSFSVEIEESLKRVSGFNPRAVQWIDERIDERKRKDDYASNYLGRDTIEAFEGYLDRLFDANEGGDAGDFGPPTSVDKNLICHEAQIERSSNPSEPKLCIQADFGFRYEAGVKYVLRRVRLNLTTDCTQGSAGSRLGQIAIHQNGSVTIAARGTDRQPFWDIAPNNVDTDVLSGLIEIRTPPLARLDRYRPGARISTQMLVNVLDGHIVPDPDLPELSGAQATLIERAFTLDFGTDEQETGWLTLSRHDLKLGGEG